MKLFELDDLAKYEVPNPADVDMRATRKRIELFFAAYFEARCRANQPREPKITTTFSDCPPASTSGNKAEAEQILICNEDAQAEFEYWDDLYRKGLAAIQQALNPEITLRRQRIFADRYIRGLSIYVTAQKNYTGEETVKKESMKAIIQFATALDIVIFR